MIKVVIMLDSGCRDPSVISDGKVYCHKCEVHVERQKNEVGIMPDGVRIMVSAGGRS